MKKNKTNWYDYVSKATNNRCNKINKTFLDVLGTVYSRLLQIFIIIKLLHNIKLIMRSLDRSLLSQPLNIAECAIIYKLQVREGGHSHFLKQSKLYQFKMKWVSCIAFHEHPVAASASRGLVYSHQHSKPMMSPVCAMPYHSTIFVSTEFQSVPPRWHSQQYPRRDIISYLTVRHNR